MGSFLTGPVRLFDRACGVGVCGAGVPTSIIAALLRTHSLSLPPPPHKLLSSHHGRPPGRRARRRRRRGGNRPQTPRRGQRGLEFGEAEVESGGKRRKNKKRAGRLSEAARPGGVTGGARVIRREAAGTLVGPRITRCRALVGLKCAQSFPPTQSTHPIHAPSHF